MVITTQNINQKPGYKQTEVGVIPEDWEVKKLGDVARIYRGASPRPIEDPKWFNEYSKVGWVRISDVTNSIKYLFNTTQMLSEIGIKQSRFVEQENLIMSICATVGRPIITKIDVCIHDGFVILEKPRINTEYLFYYLSSIENMWSKNGQTGSQMNLNTTIIENANISFPKNPKEQATIVTILSNTDALIESLDKLIAKKRDIKQATMQQLLNGKMRLPGFGEELKGEYKRTEVGIIPEDWEIHALGDEIDQLEAGVSVNSVDEEFHVYAHEQAILKTSAVLNGYFLSHENKKIAPRDIKRAKLHPRVDSIIISRMNTPDLVGECGYVDKDYPNLFLPDRLWMTRFKRGSKINIKWLSYLLSYRAYKVKIKEAATGTSGSMKNISKDSLLSINILFPKPEEQTAIATVLSNMDAEIAALEQKRDKTRALKQGMMQELLTGKTRLL